jgi:ketosteroid isomerase-like protein
MGAMSTLDALRDWFTTLERCVRAVDYDSGRKLFAPEVAAFGTRAEMVTGLDTLQVQQWSGVWPFIEGFTFQLDQLHGDIAEHLAWAAVPWTSTGFHEDGSAFTRPGRATVAFAYRDGRWIATHTHFSLHPGTPPRSYGRRERSA